jgi:hypothetical protein
MSDRQFEHAVRDWLEDGSDRTPPAAVNAVLLAVKTTPQEWDLAIPRRFSLMSMTMKLAAGIAVVAIAVGAVYVIGPRLGVGGPAPTTAPTPTAAPTTSSTATRLIDRSAEAGYTVTVPAGWHESAQATGLYFSTPAPLTSASTVEGGVEPGTSPASYLLSYVNGASGTSPLRGMDTAGLLDSLNTFYRTVVSSEPGAQSSVTVDGEQALVIEHQGEGPALFFIDGVVIHDEHAYSFSVVAGPEAEAEARAAFASLLASIRWTN